MPLQMPRPMKRPGSTFHQLVQRIPADIAGRAVGMRLAIPVGVETADILITPGRKDIRTSLRTRDPREARERQAVAVAYLEAVWRSVREGPRRLTHKEAVALAGEAYRTLVERVEDDPGPVAGWAIREAQNLQAEFGKFGFGRAGLKIGVGEADRRRESLEELLGPVADGFLSRRGLIIDAESRARLLEQLLSADRQASLLNLRRAEGDYSPDLEASRFPAFPEATKAPSSVNLLDLFDGWARERKPSQSTVDQWRKHCESFLAFLGKDDAWQVMKADVVRWKDALVAAGGSPKTINDSKLAALRVAFEWGVKNVRVSSNPAAGVAVAFKVRLQDRMQGFDDAEAAAILNAAARENRPAIRWLPLLCATTGARVGEMAQLRGEDVITRDGIPAVRITAEAGSVKNAGSERTVPLHPAVLEAGFMAFVGERKGPLFFNAERRKADAKKPSHKIVTKNVANWVKELGLETGRANRKDPSHAWRHRFKTLARAAGINDSVADTIVGHAPDSVAKAYGTVTLATMRDAIARIPVPR